MPAVVGGETAISFAADVGNNGAVYSFEFIRSNIEVFKKNLQLQENDLQKRIHLEEKPLWSQEGEVLYFKDNGPGSKVSFQAGNGFDQKVRTESIDHFVKRQGLLKVDFIKMDIEGAELSALKGAIKTLKKFRPKLAISVYHNAGRDILEIPQWLENLQLDYQFHLGHYTIHSEETILYAKVGDGEKSSLAVKSLSSANRSLLQVPKLIEAYFKDVLLNKAQRGLRLALYGAGDHSKWLLSIFKERPDLFTVIFDDSPKSSRLGAIPVVPLKYFDQYDFDEIIISSDIHHQKIPSKAGDIGLS